SRKRSRDRKKRLSGPPQVRPCRLRAGHPWRARSRKSLFALTPAPTLRLIPSIPCTGVTELSRYAELHCLSNFTFLRGASHPHELVERADALGYSALALTDECSVAGVVRAHMAAKNRSLRLIVGAEFRLTCGLRLAALAI